jgi:hypothetical protein
VHVSFPPTLATCPACLILLDLIKAKKYSGVKRFVNRSKSYFELNCKFWLRSSVTFSARSERTQILVFEGNKRASGGRANRLVIWSMSSESVEKVWHIMGLHQNNKFSSCARFKFRISAMEWLGSCPNSGDFVLYMCAIINCVNWKVPTDAAAVPLIILPYTLVSPGTSTSQVRWVLQYRHTLTCDSERRTVRQPVYIASNHWRTVLEQTETY